MSKRKIQSTGESQHKRSRSSQPEVYDDEDLEFPTISELEADPVSSVSTTGDVGIIESITLKNFMCHAHLGPFTFGPNVNFVVGNNGSGKSAVLTALIVALGGNAQTTSRGSSLKCFVKEGESSAEVSITIKNRGNDAFKPEVYGESIILDLRISSEGLRTYKLRSKTGQLISSKKDELISILDFFNIQVDNPVSILTQEMSKHFLHSKGEADKYKFFMKATQLEQMNEDYDYIIKTQGLTQNTVDQHEETLEELKRMFKEKEEKYKGLSSLEEMNKKLDNLKNQMAWALVNEMERELGPMSDRMEAEERSTPKYDQKVAEWKAKVDEAERKYREQHEQLEQVTERLQQRRPQGAQLRSDVQERNRAVKAVEASSHKLKTNQRDLEKDKEQLTKRIDELKLSISTASAADSQAREARLAGLQLELEDLAHRDSTLTQQLDQFQQAVAAAKDNLDKMRREEQDLQRSCNSKEQSLRQLEASRTNRIRRFGEHMPALLNAIDEAYNKGVFRKKPVGPLGYCIRLKDPSLAMAVESCLKSLLMAFCCDNHQDERHLQALAMRYLKDKRPTIIVSQYSDALYNVSHRAVNHPQYLSVLQALEIDDPNVANCLIDMRGIETILVIKNTAEARRVMQHNRPPQNCREAFTGTGDQVFTNRYYSTDANARARVLGGDVEEEISHLQVSLNSQQENLTRLRQHKQTLDAEIRQNNALLKTTHDERTKVKNQSRRLQLEISELQNVEEPQSEDLVPLEEELEEIMEKLSVSGQMCAEAQEKLKVARSAAAESEQNYRRHRELIASAAEEAEPIREELSKCDQEVEKCKHHRKHYEEKRKAHINNIQELKNNLQQRERELKESISKASEICPERLEVRKSAKSLDLEISRLRAVINTQQEQQGDRELIIRQYQEAHQKYTTTTREVKILKKFGEVISEIIHHRQKAYAKLRGFYSLRCKYYFDMTLAQRGYVGHMNFDHKNKALSIAVQPGGKNKASLSDMRSLSGGERSFSTVCFVLSLWSITESPFRALDEFDVYMDMVNRRISMDMFLKVASSQRYRQFIFLTPQSMSSLPVNSLIRILRLNDPDRNQTVLPFGQRNYPDD
ncbi:structural maintenance of chromosomes protein 6 isoform X1 [Alosa sapidissima]|uniref:structural maintenance of chromosomes protein 6 isoform X1 n=1 Tax=Alosa sapidissima TaxID=34773 RepID=UPI001C092F33|nr:structural maintenance of chromosomes protein 6 isoform X1 [Alosa sapidissima]XP_041951261.1 structural maintenance of chromosomes protein 6 isoform X1 [Alosa sapidissima]XP_041951262.1 structural maintenance of chromosomes protein 6 isoform X1 [Alosa sapidissima]XP_041951263.1 structural maintenance of chromosomes protein 6 isoform X1 [Alosa sapidissima]